MILLFPVYQPSDRLPSLLTELRAAAPEADLLVVDDGSGPPSTQVLETSETLGATVLRHDRNRGKGEALKTGFRYAAEHRPGQTVVCADADGQHSVEDILRVAARAAETGHIVLGVRQFEDDVPLRSKFGNAVTQTLFRAATGRPVQDTQTGLRAFPADQLEWLLTVQGERFEYEMSVLIEAVRTGRPMDEVVIDTTYLKDNASSHFGALSDSARIYWPLLRSLALSLRAPSRR
ncbi:glycosyltransferase family 2 protein [Actinoplanes friuliensis]|uniref:Family 2 glycosyl transferase n=1 Tax=Actinoplanes friuliensis DSM 7358 TaxID=1246995 RepID=U5W5E6_9ACTN|nr:glycosyltransferase family 2 protein [Actinoplanes friuliensis]AGZ44232.1 family 2 glycosyl transferase [Actinoplanes friuliensis DSM 7358]